MLQCVFAWVYFHTKVRMGVRCCSACLRGYVVPYVPRPVRNGCRRVCDHVFAWVWFHIKVRNRARCCVRVCVRIWYRTYQGEMSGP